SSRVSTLRAVANEFLRRRLLTIDIIFVPCPLARCPAVTVRIANPTAATTADAGAAGGCRGAIVSPLDVAPPKDHLTMRRPHRFLLSLTLFALGCGNAAPQGVVLYCA